MGLGRDFRRFVKHNTSLLKRRVTGQALLRRLKEIPALEPGTVEVVVYFADEPVNLYQIRQWYQPLAELAKTHRVAVLSRNALSAMILLDECPVPVVYAYKVASVEDFLLRQPAKVVLYVNQNALNFRMFRYGNRWHVFISHGESDKVYMASNQLKSYDYTFVAGQAAIDRIQAALWGYDVAKRAIPIGRPQADHFATELPYQSDSRIVVLYAPTWEGDRASMQYGSVISHGEALAQRLLASDQHRLIYRPHPRSGIEKAGYRAANARIIAAIRAANAANPAAGHIYDDGPDAGWALAVADVAVTDISAMVYDRLATGRPLLVTRPVAEEAKVDETGYLGACEWLMAERAPEIIDEADRVLTSPEMVKRLGFWSERYFGDTSLGSATKRFHGAIEQLLAEWDQHAALHPEAAQAALEGQRCAHEKWLRRQSDPELQPDD